MKHEGWESATGSLDLDLAPAAARPARSVRGPDPTSGPSRWGWSRPPTSDDCGSGTSWTAFVRPRSCWPPTGPPTTSAPAPGCQGSSWRSPAPTLRMTLVESRRPRAAFLQLVVDRLGLANDGRQPTNGWRRSSEPVDVCFSRAFARVGRRLACRGPAPDARWAARLLRRRAIRQRRSARDAVSTLVTTPALARSGPLVIMSRQ